MKDRSEVHPIDLIEQVRLKIAFLSNIDEREETHDGNQGNFFLLQDLNDQLAEAVARLNEMTICSADNEQPPLKEISGKETGDLLDVADVLHDAIDGLTFLTESAPATYEGAALSRNALNGLFTMIGVIVNNLEGARFVLKQMSESAADKQTV